MKDNHSLTRKWRIVIILFFVFLLFIFAQDIVREVVVFGQEKELIKEELDRDIRIEAKNNVEQISSDFNFTIETLGNELTEHSKENLQGLFFASNTFFKMNSTLLEEEIIDGITEITSEYNALDPLHYYYVYDIDGKMYYNGSTDSFITVDMSLEKDFFNKVYIDEFTSGFSTDDISSTDYYILTDNEVVNYVIYGQRIEGTDLVIANVVNMRKFSNEQRTHSLINIDDKYGSSSKELFIIDTDGTILYNENIDFIGENLESTDIIIKEYLTQVVTVASSKTSGYIDTKMYNGDSIVKDNTSYINVISEWGLIIVSNIETDKYNDIIENYTDANYKLVLLIKVPSYIFLLITSIIIYIYLSATIKESQLVVAEDEVLYRKFANLTSEIILITNKQGEIIFCNKLGVKIIYGKRDISTKISFDQIFVEEQGFYILYGYNEDYYVKFVTEPIEYNHQNADLFMITDVTEKIKTERKLEALSLVDELTKLGNRRMMVRQYSDTVLPYLKTGKDAYLVMLDLDDFKPANDLYGHSYGDIVLKQVSSIFSKNKSKDILIFRIGGDEFALFFLNDTKDGVYDKLIQMQKEVKEYEYSKELNLSFSAGVTEIKVTDKQRRFSDYYDRADKLLYKAKHEGKSKIYM